MDRQIDVFEIIEDAGIWLMFQPLPRLFGAYRRYGDVAGIIVNSNHPVSLQRYTAAHEYGHHVLRHEQSIDAEDSIVGVQHNEQEMAAQAFAADFVMPLQLVNLALRRVGIDIHPTHISPLDVYKLSLSIGSSYAATVTQLVSLKKITPKAAGLLRRERPIAIKEALAGARPADARSDVWLIEETESGGEVSTHVNDEVHVLLSETPSTGYIWKVEFPQAIVSPGVRVNDTLALIGDAFEQSGALPAKELYGASGLHRLVFRVLRPGTCHLRVAKSRPWQPTAPSAVFEARIHARERATGDTDRGLSLHQKQLLTADSPTASNGRPPH